MALLPSSLRQTAGNIGALERRHWLVLCAWAALVGVAFGRFWPSNRWPAPLLFGTIFVGVAGVHAWQRRERGAAWSPNLLLAISEATIGIAIAVALTWIYRRF